MKILWLILGFLGLAAVGFLIVVLIASNLSITDAQGISVVLKIVNLSGCVYLFVLGALLMYGIVRLLIRGLNTIAVQTHSKIISVGVVSLVYFKSIYAIVVVPLIALTFNTSQFISEGSRTDWQTDTLSVQRSINNSVPNYTGGPSPNMNSMDNAGDGYFLLRQSGNIFSYYLEGSVTIVSRLITETLTGRVEVDDFQDKEAPPAWRNLKHIALGILLLYLTGAMCDNITGSGSGNQYFLTFRSWMYKYRMNLLFIGIFITGGFLGMSAIIAIPVFQQGTSLQGLTLEQFKKKIADSYPSYIKVDSAHDERSTELKNMILFLNDLEKSVTDTKGPVTNLPTTTEVFDNKQKSALSNIRRWRDEITLLQTSHQILQSSYSKIAEKYIQKISDEKTKIERRYENSLEEVAIGNARWLFHDNCFQYLDQYADNFKRAFSNYKDAAEWSINSDLARIGFLKQDFSTMIPELKDTTYYSLRAANTGYAYFNPAPEWSRYNYYEEYQHLPEFGKINSISGFVKMANWLIETKNKEMILIIGMLGFGLLGAGVSSLIRNRTQGVIPMFNSNATSTLVGGVSASLVIFLSAKGGTAILSTNDIDLNMYTLLFICLIGSVFSETIWEKAYNYLNNGKNNNGGNGGGGGNGNGGNGGGTGTGGNGGTGDEPVKPPQ